MIINEKYEDGSTLIDKINNKLDPGAPTLDDILDGKVNDDKTSQDEFPDDLEEEEIELEESYDKLVIYKDGGCYKVTPESNYNARISDARKINSCEDFESPEEIISYFSKYWGSKPEDFKIIEESCITEARTKDPESLDEELSEITDLYEEFGPQGFYNVPFKKFIAEFPNFGKDVILTFISEMEIRTPEEMEDAETLETDWATGELIISKDWPCLLEGAKILVNGRGKNNKHQIQWEKLWKKYYKAYDESFNL